MQKEITRKTAFPILKYCTSTILLLLIVSTKSWATQDSSSVNLQAREITIAKVFKTLHQQTGFIVFYSNKLLDDQEKLDVNFVHAGIGQVMDYVIKGRKLTYTFKNHFIVLQRIKNKSLMSLELTPQSSIIVADTALVKGIVRNESGEPLVGVTIKVKNKNTGAFTNAGGVFEMIVEEGSTLQFSYIGYVSQEMKVRGQRRLTVILKHTNNDLDEVVVIGYMTQKKREITGAISEIKAKDIENRPIQTFDQAMQGKMAGVLVQSATGVPGGAVKVVIRGQGSISAGTQPLYVVDGIPINSEDAPGNTSSNPLSFLNPNDIASIEVLKDAAAASIYGAGGANGVILITTKSGFKGKTAYTLNYTKGWVEPLPIKQMMNTQQYLTARMEATHNRYPNRSPTEVRKNILQESHLPINMTDEELYKLPTYNWQKEVFRVGKTNIADFAMTGGGSNTTFRLSASYNSTEGSVIGTDFSRATASLKLNQKIASKVELRAHINLSSVTQKGPIGSYGSNLFLSSPQWSAPMILPFVPIRLEDGSYNAPQGGFAGNYRYNSIQATEVNTIRNKNITVFPNLRLIYNINKALSWRSYFGVSYNNIDQYSYLDPRSQEGTVIKGRLDLSSRKPLYFTTTHYLNFEHSFKKNKISGVIGLEYRTYEIQYTSVRGQGFPTYQFRELQSAALISDATSSWTGVKRASVFSQLNYNYNGKYLFSAVLRRDGSSRFGANNRYGWFPALSAGWDIAREDFAKNLSWLGQAKLRAGWGETGNDNISNFSARALYGGGSSYGGSSGIKPDALGNPDLRWEKNVTFNLGLDYSFFNRRLYGSIDVFKRTSKDLLLRVPVPWLSGYSSIYQNVGALQNKGLEIEMNSDIIRQSNFSWNASFNITFLDNKVTKLYDDLNELPGSPSVRVGYPLETNFVAQYAGVNSATGRPFWYNHDGSISYSPDAQGASSYLPYPRGSRLSKYYGGFTNTLKYKGLELIVFLQYDMGRELFNLQNSSWSGSGDDMRNGTEWFYVNRWTTLGQITSVPRPVDGYAEVGAASAKMSSSRFLEDASYIRLKEVAVSYDFPPIIRSRLPILNDGKIFLKVSNLYTWTKWTGYDPEFYIDGGNFSSNGGVIPHTRSYILGIQLKF